MTTRTLLPRGLTLAPQYADLTPSALAVAWSHWSDASDRRAWCFPFGGALLGLDRERVEIVRDALVRYFTAAGRGMRWMQSTPAGVQSLGGLQ